MLDEEWRDYEKKLLDPIHAGPVQRQECRRAFYAGAAAVFYGMVRGVSDEDAPTEADDAMMAGIHAGLQQFTKDLKAGNA